MKIDLNRPMKEILADLTKYPVSTRLSLSGTIIVAILHMPNLKNVWIGEKTSRSVFQDHPIYYAGPAKTPKGICVRFDGSNLLQDVWIRMSIYFNRTAAA